MYCTITVQSFCGRHALNGQQTKFLEDVGGNEILRRFQGSRGESVQFLWEICGDLMENALQLHDIQTISADFTRLLPKSSCEK